MTCGGDMTTLADFKRLRALSLVTVPEGTPDIRPPPRSRTAKRVKRGALEPIPDSLRPVAAVTADDAEQQDAVEAATAVEAAPAPIVKPRLVARVSEARAVAAESLEAARTVREPDDVAPAPSALVSERAAEEPTPSAPERVVAKPASSAPARAVAEPAPSEDPPVPARLDGASVRLELELISGEVVSQRCERPKKRPRTEPSIITVDRKAHPSVTVTSTQLAVITPEMADSFPVYRPSKPAESSARVKNLVPAAPTANTPMPGRVANPRPSIPLPPTSSRLLEPVTAEEAPAVAQVHAKAAQERSEHVVPQAAVPMAEQRAVAMPVIDPRALAEVPTSVLESSEDATPADEIDIDSIELDVFQSGNANAVLFGVLAILGAGAAALYFLL